MGMIEEINFVIASYVDEDGRIKDNTCIEEIEERFKVNKIGYKINCNYCDCGPGYEQWFYVFSWIEYGRLYTYEILVQWC